MTTTINVIRFTVPGKAVPAVRMTQRSKWNSRSARYLQYKDVVGWQARAAGAEAITGNVAARLVFYTHNRRSDLDNLIKSILDSCNKICYADDKQVTQIEAKIIPTTEQEQRVEVEFTTHIGSGKHGSIAASTDSD